MRTIYSNDGPEISDIIVPQTLDRVPVRKQDVINELQKHNNKFAISVVERLKCHGDFLDPEAVDKLLIKAHCEMQRLSEEFYHGNRVKDLLIPLIKTIRDSGFGRTIRIVDIGCGTGYVVRWLAKYGNLPDDVQVAGVDFNKALVDEATRLSVQENIHCRFLHANAFALKESATIFLSTGVLHHFNSAESLTKFLEAHQCVETLNAFVHFDFQPNAIAPFGSWVFHIMRMREPLCWHDGVLSAARAHSSSTLVQAARTGAPGFVSGMYGQRFWKSPVPRVFHTLIGLRPDLKDPFLKNLGCLAVQMGELK